MKLELGKEPRESTARQDAGQNLSGRSGGPSNALEHVGHGPTIETLHHRVFGVGIDVFEDASHVLSDQALGMGFVVVHAEAGFRAEGVTDFAQSDFFGIARQRPSTSAGALGLDEIGLSEQRQLAADDDRIGSNTQGDELRCEPLLRQGGQQGEDMDRGGKPGVHTEKIQVWVRKMHLPAAPTLM